MIRECCRLSGGWLAVGCWPLAQFSSCNLPSSFEVLGCGLWRDCETDRAKTQVKCIIMGRLAEWPSGRE